MLTKDLLSIPAILTPRSGQLTPSFSLGITAGFLMR